MEWFLHHKCIVAVPRIYNLLNNIGFLSGCVALMLLISLYDFVVYPLLYNYIPTVLKRIEVECS